MLEWYAIQVSDEYTRQSDQLWDWLKAGRLLMVQEMFTSAEGASL